MDVVKKSENKNLENVKNNEEEIRNVMNPILFKESQENLDNLECNVRELNEKSSLEINQNEEIVKLLLYSPKYDSFEENSFSDENEFSEISTLEYNFDIDPSSAKGVLQGEVAVTQHNSKYPILGSFGAGPCVIISMFHRESKKCSLAHIDIASTRFSSFNLMKKLLKVTKNNLEVEVATSKISNNKTLEALKDFIQKKSRLILKNIHPTSSLGIDSRTGKTFKIADPFSLDLGNNYENRMEKRTSESFRNFLSLSTIYNGIIEHEIEDLIQESKCQDAISFFDWIKQNTSIHIDYSKISNFFYEKRMKEYN